MSLISRWTRGVPPDFLLFLAAVWLVGFSQSALDSTFNNFLSDKFSLTDSQRMIIEIPREIPGLLVVFVSGLLFFFCSRRMAAVANILAAVGLILFGQLSSSFGLMLLWLFIYSMGQHLFLPLISGIGMELAKEGKDGRVLGQIQGAMNLAAIVGSFMVFIGFSYLKFSFALSFAIAAAGYLAAAFLILAMTPDTPAPFKSKFRFRREYKTYYWLTILYGTRKQIFLTFAPWVLVTVYDQKTQFIATLLTIGGVVGIFFKPFLGWVMDRFGERVVLSGEALMLVLVCAGYGFARDIMPPGLALALAATCYVADNMLMSVGMARATYLKKIAVDPADITQTLVLGLSIDHVFSISVAIAGGLIWTRFGYQYVFLFGSLVAAVNFFVALSVRVPERAPCAADQSMLIQDND